ncbi:MAG: rRNA pseudouridine synthase [Lachnospiraceae bacterium]|nr:rRNA pseudouridine synthase [Lachnospiraceae bacterium]
MIRLDKYVSENLPCTRSEAKKLLASDKIMVDGTIIKNGEYKLDENSAEVICCGKVLKSIKGLYYMLNKPEGVVSAVTDKEHKTVNDLFPKEVNKKIFPVGRLDIDTEGLLIMTDDGDFCHRLVSPKKQVYKIYVAKCTGELAKDAEKIFKEGIAFKDFTTKPAEIEFLYEKNGFIFVEVKICEGRFHQVKRMLHHVGADVVYLKRTAIGDLLLDEKLEPGQYRALTEEELAIFK